MKKFYVSLFPICCFLANLSQAQVGIGTSSPNSSAQLDVSSTNKGFLVPRMNASQKGAISSPATGLLIYQTDGSAGFYYYTGSEWLYLTTALLSKVGGSDFTNSMLIGNSTTGTLNAAEKNLGVGSGTLQALTDGDYNTAVGYHSLFSTTEGLNNIGLGSESLNDNTVGENNLAIGHNALKTNSGGLRSIAIGNYAMANFDDYPGTFDSDNLAIGYESLKGGSSTASNNMFYGNVAIGNYALKANNTGLGNVAIGLSAQFSNYNGEHNTGIGFKTMYTNVSGSNNVALGYRSLYDNNGGSYNMAIGAYSLDQNTNGSSNTAVGENTLGTNTTGSSNTAIGNSAGAGVISGSNLTMIGFQAYASSSTATNEITLGNTSVSNLRCNDQTISALSDRRDKKEIKPITEGINFVKKLNPVTFTWCTRDRSKVGIEDAGFIAQELLLLQKESPIGKHLDLVNFSNPNRLEAQYANLLPVLVKAIQEQNELIETQKLMINNLQVETAKANSDNIKQQAELENVKILLQTSNAKL